MLLGTVLLGKGRAKDCNQKLLVFAVLIGAQLGLGKGVRLVKQCRACALQKLDMCFLALGARTAQQGLELLLALALDAGARLLGSLGKVVCHAAAILLRLLQHALGTGACIRANAFKNFFKSGHDQPTGANSTIRREISSAKIA